MVIYNIDKYTLPENVINLMKEQLKNSNTTGIEMGLTMCGNKDNIIEEKNITKSTGEEIMIKYGCPSGFNMIGTYHTHPNQLSRPSASDLLNTCDNIADCIGGGADNKIMCYIRKKEIDPIDCTKEFSELNSLDSELRQRSLIYDKEREFLLKQRKHLTEIKPRTRKIDVELREIKSKIKKHNENTSQFNIEMISLDKNLLQVQHKYFEEREIR